jgi:hypothetical protein
MTPNVTCFVDSDLVHSAYAVTGLIELSREGRIRLGFGLTSRRVAGVRGVFTTCMEVRFDEGERAALVCLDFHDAAEYLCKASLEACDVYFKANLSAKTVVAAGSASEKLRAFGPYFPCRPTTDRRFLSRCFGNSFAHLRFRLRGATKKTTLFRKFRDAAAQTRRYRRYLSRHRWDAYESPPSEARPADGLVAFFNPTCWTESNEKVRAINQFRARAIVELRRLLGQRFAGGFRHNELAEREYSEALEDRHYSHDEYLEHLKRAPIAIYTNGLDDCFSWRLIEVLAAGKCVVSERIPNDPGFLLDRDAGVIQCHSAEDVARTVAELERSPTLVREMQESAWRTYERRLRPHVRMQALIDEIQEHFSNAIETRKSTT